ncbi:ABC transporter permease [Metallumcola ferriviriculae]|uniref:ABC transporter permease n=1 Tax=Metallumcola ferriviriculae TaxID=3039180 RepID=A0AAU0UR69_9FIRM|nr:ABC transporter permease [Desulfitibacteraceae bacterium MK1]
MNTPGKLFLNRLANEWKFQYGVWKTVFDWTIILYVVVPTIIIIVRQYLLLLHNVPPQFKLMPLELYVGIVFLITWRGRIRLFLEQADQLFLNQNDHWYGGLLKMSIFYYLVKSVVISAALFAVLAPIFFQIYSFTWGQIVRFYVIAVLAKFIFGIFRQLLIRKFHGFKGKLVQIIFFILWGIVFRYLAPLVISSEAYAMAVIGGVLAIAVTLAVKRISMRGMFLEDWAQAVEEKLKYVGFILSVSGQKVKRPGARRKRPWLFRNSGNIFRIRSGSNILIEFGLKSFLRNKGAVLIYLQVILFGTLFMLSLPAQWRWMVLAVLAFILASLVRLHWVEEFYSDFMQLFPWKQELKHTAAEKFIFITTLPGFLAMSFFYGLTTFSLLGALAAPPIAFFFLRYLVRNIVLFAKI